MQEDRLAAVVVAAIVAAAAAADQNNQDQNNARAISAPTVEHFLSPRYVRISIYYAGGRKAVIPLLTKAGSLLESLRQQETRCAGCNGVAA